MQSRDGFGKPFYSSPLSENIAAVLLRSLAEHVSLQRKLLVRFHKGYFKCFVFRVNSCLLACSVWS